MSEWRTIDSAPKDEPILGWWRHEGVECMDILCWYDGEAWIGWLHDHVAQPTHWQPLPDPPKE